jgi:hypothetical protein
MDIQTALSNTILNVNYGDFAKGFGFRLVNAQGGDETFTLRPNADGTWSVIAPNGAAWLTIEQNGTFGFRLLSEHPEPGGWEKFTRQGNVLTEVPKDGVTRPLVQLIARDL